MAASTANRAARIGPNAVTRLVEALADAGLSAFTAEIFDHAGCADWLTSPPSVMISEQQVARLHQALRHDLPPNVATAVLRHAGKLTADYLLAVRIPHAAQWLLKQLPPRLAAMALVAAIGHNAWTFAGSGRFGRQWNGRLCLSIAGNPLCANETAEHPVCVWHQAVFQRLFETLVSRHSHVVETACHACGSPACCFEIDWRPPRGRSTNR